MWFPRLSSSQSLCPCFLLCEAWREIQLVLPGKFWIQSHTYDSISGSGSSLEANVFLCVCVCLCVYVCLRVVCDYGIEMGCGLMCFTLLQKTGMNILMMNKNYLQYLFWHLKKIVFVSIFIFPHFFTFVKGIFIFSLENGGILWFENLTMYDPFYALPIFMAVMMAIQVLWKNLSFYPALLTSTQILYSVISFHTHTHNHTPHKCSTIFWLLNIQTTYG